MDNLWIIYGYGWWLSPTPLKHMSSSIGMMTFPTEWENKIHVPNHQPVMVFQMLPKSFFSIENCHLERGNSEVIQFQDRPTGS